MPAQLKDLFRKNLLLLVDQQEKSTTSQPKIAGRGSLGQRTVGRALKSEVSPRLTTVEGLAKAFDVAPWQLLHPTLGKVPQASTQDPILFQLIDLYNQLDDDHKHLLTSVANGFVAQNSTMKSASAPYNGVRIGSNPPATRKQQAPVAAQPAGKYHPRKV